ncbi:hypothetical protein ACFWTC_31800 [Streptomyces sp. NPDC058619]|uniref:hypothetical protein n=1 Tax=unclassified Streptomyces TaxID=2593676 RepID=UPI003666F356
MNLLRNLLSNPKFATQVRDSPDPISLQEVMQKHAPAFNPDHNYLELERLPGAHGVTDLGILKAAQMFRLPVDHLGEPDEEDPIPFDPHHGDLQWLEAHYVDEDKKEVVIYPNDETPTPMLMMYALEENSEAQLVVVGAELKATEDKRNVLSLFRRHPHCPTSYQPDGSLYCQPRNCGKGTCKKTTVYRLWGAKVFCRCHHGS